MSALTQSVAAELAEVENVPSGLINRILEAGERAFFAEFDKHKDMQIKKKILEIRE